MIHKRAEALLIIVISVSMPIKMAGCSCGKKRTLTCSEYNAMIENDNSVNMLRVKVNMIVKVTSITMKWTKMMKWIQVVSLC